MSGFFDDVPRSTERQRRGTVVVAGAVPDSFELRRIVGLPRREFDLASYPDVTPLFAREPSLTGYYWPIQSAALVEASLAGGLFGILGVGSGKTLIGLSLPRALSAKRAVLLVKSQLARSLDRQIAQYEKHLSLPLTQLEVVTYEELSERNTADALDRIDPDLIICDECQSIAAYTSARGKRFRRFAKEHPGTKYAFMSGTVTRRKLDDYAHLVELALRKNSPVPGSRQEVRDWGGVLDVDPDYVMKPGALKQLCAPGEDARAGFRRRLVQTCGVVAHDAENVSCSLTVRRVSVALPKKIKDTIKRVEKTWKLPCGQEILLATDMSEARAQLAQGFYYRMDWSFRGGEPDEEWLVARADFSREVNERLKGAGRGYDSRKLLEIAAERHRLGEPGGRKWASQYWDAWRRVKDRPKPARETVIVDISGVIEFAKGWLEQGDGRGIIWTRYTGQARYLEDELRLPTYNEGDDAEEAVERKHPAIICSIGSQGTGKNLQAQFSRSLILTPRIGGGTVEQLIGRTHRHGQLADEVEIDLACSIPPHDAALGRIMEDSRYVEETTTTRQKVLYADRVGW